MNNKIVIFTNMKGGTGKTTLLELFASYAAEQGIPLLVMDADPQLSLYKDRRDDLQDSPEAQIPWNVRPMRLDDNVQAVISQAKAVPGIVLIDCPGNIDNPNLQYLFRAADVAVMPFKYDRKNVRETATFCGIFRKINDKARILFVPNMSMSFEEHRAELLLARNMSYEIFKPYRGYITKSIMHRLELQCCNTIGLNYRQRREVRVPFDEIIERIK